MSFSFKWSGDFLTEFYLADGLFYSLFHALSEK